MLKRAGIRARDIWGEEENLVLAFRSILLRKDDQRTEKHCYKRTQKKSQFYISNLFLLKLGTEFPLTLLTGKIEQGIRQKLLLVDGIKHKCVLS